MYELQDTEKIGLCGGALCSGEHGGIRKAEGEKDEGTLHI